MVNTKYVKVEFGQIAYSQSEKEIQQITLGNSQGRSEIIKMIQKGTDEVTFSGYRKVNFSDQKMKEAYRKLNKMLGGD